MTGGKGGIFLLSYKLKNRLQQMPPMRILLLGYCGIILLGTLLLALPISSREGTTPLSDCFFTATSATCVTGLIRFDTYTHWTFFGQAVILGMIQIGGIGFMTVIVTLISLTKKKIGLNTRFVMQNSFAAPQVGGIIRLTKLVMIGTAIIEGIGAVLLAFYFIPKLGFLRGLWFSVFHSVSAFCNAGFDLMGRLSPFSSLTAAGDNWYVNLIIMLLIIIGGLGFVVWVDLLSNRFRVKKLCLHSRVVLIFSGILIFVGTAGILLFEANGTGLGDGSVMSRVLKAMFQSVSTRTAGFNSVALDQLTQPSQLLMICLMLIGGSPGSTAGGMKTTTFAVLIMSVQTVFRKKQNIEICKRRLNPNVLQSSACVFITYLLLLVVSGMCISALEGLPMLTCLFETGSAIGTVGMSLGITPTLSMLSKLLLTALMIFGRLGSITMILAFSMEDETGGARYPLGKLQIG